MSARLISSSCAWDFAIWSWFATSVTPHSVRSALKRSRTRPARLTVRNTRRSLRAAVGRGGEARRACSPTSRGGRWGGARAHHQLGRHDLAARILPGALDGAEERAHAAPTDLAEVLADRRQRRGEVGGLRDVVEAEDAAVPRHVAPGLVERAQQAERHLV